MTDTTQQNLVRCKHHCKLDYCNSALAGVAKVYFKKNSSQCRIWLLVW